MSSLSDSSILAGGSGGTGVSVYSIDQSIRFNDDDTAYMSKTISSTSSRTTWTFSTWFKLGNAGITVSYSGLFNSVWNSSNYVNIGISNSSGYGIDFLLYNSNSTLGRLYTTRSFRDPSAWYHLVAVLDTTNNTSSERMRLYINGQRETIFTNETYPSKDATPLVNYATAVHSLGRVYNAGTYSGYYYDGYMAETHFLDGYAYGPEYFGVSNSSGIWIPIEYTGSYGTNGFKIDGSDSSDLGTDAAGSNDYTASGFETNDQVVDSPTNNFAVMNPVDADGLAANELSGGNLQVKNINRIKASIPFPTSGQWYWEICTVSKSGQVNWNYGMVYFKDHSNFITTNTDFLRLNWYHGSNFSSSSNWTDGDFWTNSNNPSAGSVYGFAWDAGTRKVYLAKDGTYFGSADPANGTGTAWGSGGTAGVEYGIAMYSTQSFIHTINFGQDDSFNGAKTSGSAGAADDNGNGKFYYAPPTGFLALCTKNLGS